MGFNLSGYIDSNATTIDRGDRSIFGCDFNTGKVVLDAGDGNDYINGGRGHDILYGMDGNDTIRGGSGIKV
jgi:Ca2+-binding RTX toxin-like protein